MSEEYNLYSKFDVSKHKQTYTNYLEVIMDSDGNVMYAVPSHQEKMIALACKKLCVDRDGLDKMCPEEYYFDFLIWLSKVSGAVAVWNEFVQGFSFTEAQIRTLKMLKSEGVYKGEIPKISLENECHKLSVGGA